MKNTNNKYNKKILLLYPKSTDDSLKLIPLSLLYIARPLLKAGFTVEILDQRCDPLFFERLNTLLNQDIICIGITCITGTQIKNVIAIMNFIKKKSNIPIVLGGSHPTILPKQTLRSSIADYVIISDGEIPFLKLVKALKDKKETKNITGLCFRRNGEILLNQPNWAININYRKKVVPIPYYLIQRYNYSEVVPIISSYGCFGHCAFCIERVLHPQCFFLPVKNIVSMIENGLRLGVKTIDFIDDNFLMSKKRVKEIFDVCKRKNLFFEWVCSGRVDIVLSFGNEFLIWLKERGLLSIFFGVESGSPKILKRIKKGITTAMVLRLNRKFKKLGIKVNFSFMAGFPTETKKDLEDTFRLIRYLKKDNPEATIWKINKFTPYPETALFELAKEYGFNSPETFEGWHKVHFYNHTYKHNFDMKL